MESVLNFIYENAQSAHWVIFLLIMLAGLNVPFSEDILIITGGALTATLLPHSTLQMFIWLFAAAWLSAWEAYWIGRWFGPHLYKIRWFQATLNPERIEKLHNYYEKYGIWTFIVGRFIPGGVRNALFMSSGLGKMPFHKFILRDLPACFLSVIFLFSLGRFFGENIESITANIKLYSLIFSLIFIGVVIMYLNRKK